jgi:hypothetical protein
MVGQSGGGIGADLAMDQGQFMVGQSGGGIFVLESVRGAKRIATANRRRIMGSKILSGFSWFLTSVYSLKGEIGNTPKCFYGIRTTQIRCVAVGYS